MSVSIGVACMFTLVADTELELVGVDIMPSGAAAPQAREVVNEGEAVDGFWVAYSINKEDIGITKVNWEEALHV